MKFIKYFLGINLLMAVLLYLRSEYEKRSLTVRNYDIYSKKLLRNRKIVFISDLHDQCFGKDNEELIRRITEIAPDFVLIGGDLPTVKDDADISIGLELCRKLSSSYKVYYANGNHELRLKRKKYGSLYKILEESLAEFGVERLVDDSISPGADLRIYGLDIDWEYYERFENRDMQPSYIEKKLGKAADDSFNILLAHSPLYAKAYAEWGADLSLSGHFHGGTIRLPFDIGLMTPQFQFFSNCVVGLKKYASKYMIISAGLGTHSVRMRLNNRPELVVINLIKST